MTHPHDETAQQRHDAMRQERPFVPCMSEADIRARECRTLAELRAKPWLNGRYGVETSAGCRRRIVESLAREFADITRATL